MLQAQESASLHPMRNEKQIGLTTALISVQVSSKIGVIESLIDKVDKIILGGGMIFTFYKARGMSVGSSLVEEDKLELAKSLEEAAKKKGMLLHLVNTLGFYLL